MMRKAFFIAKTVYVSAKIARILKLCTRLFFVHLRICTIGQEKTMRICVIGGANVDITATSGRAFQFGDSNPGTVQVSWGGVGRNIAHNLALLGDEVELVTIGNRP